MDKTHYERRSHEQGNYEIIPTYKGLEPIVGPGSEVGPIS